MTFTRLGRAMLGGLALLAAAIAPAAAQDAGYPNRPITLVVPYAAGGGNDVMARIVAEKMSKTLGQNIVIENRGGAGGSIGSALLAKSDPDGYNLLIQASAHSAAPRRCAGPART